MKIFKKIFIVFGILAFSVLPVLGQDYTLFYGNGCPHCTKVEDFLKENDINKTFDLVQKEVFFNRTNLAELNDYLKKFDLSQERIGVPFLVINSGVDCNYINGDQNIIAFFEKKIKQEAETCEETTFTGTAINEKSLKQRLTFFGIMMPAALSDSINPCAFAVMLLLLGTILSRHQSRRKTLLSGALFAGAVFISYLAMGIGIFSALASSANTFYLKLAVGILGILVGLANLKDFFRYGKLFVMEVPFARRPKMMDIIHKVSTPIGAFLVGIIVSLFLLPCSSGPYFTILGYLSAENAALNTRGYIYLIVYNLIFILPMLVIAGLVGFGYSTVDRLAKIKHEKTKLIHLIVGLLMLGLGIYVLVTL